MTCRQAAIALSGLIASTFVAALPLAAQDTAIDPSPGPWAHYPVRSDAPAGAPNVLLIMTDDVGFGAASSFGGLIQTPTFDAVGTEGIRFNRFHTTAMCSPTRAALLTGRNHHAVGNGAIANLSRDLPGYTSAIPDSAATIADVLRASGYVTAFLGKNHNTPEWQAGSMGPFDNWPTGWGFDYFYGFNAAWADQYAPELVENTTQVEPPANPAYHLDADLSDHAIEWLRRRQNSAADVPFFLYLAPGSPHTPHQAPADWIARYRGAFDMGWDRARAMIFSRQKALGIIPADAMLTPRPAELPAWDDLSPDEQQVAARMMEIYAAQLSHSDWQVGRIIDELRQSGEYENTLVIFLQGDNGGDIASFNGDANEWGAFFGEEPDLGDLLPLIDELGGPRTFGGYPAAWAWATNAPFPWGKALAGQLGGIRSGAAMNWPSGMARHGAISDRFAHVIDIAPTIYQAAGITPPERFEGVVQQPIDGQSLLATFREQPADLSRDAALPRTQYFEMLGNFGFYEDGWFAGTAMMRPPWDRTSPRTAIPERIEDYPWQLYDLSEDFSQSHDLAAAHPDRLQAMIARFAEVAEANHVLPVENDVMVLLAPGMRPTALGGQTHFRYTRQGVRYVAADLPPLNGRWRLSARIETAAPRVSGPVFVQGGRFTGWGLALVDGRPAFLSRPSFDTAKHATVIAPTALEPGEHLITLDMIPDPAPGNFAARISIAVDGQQVHEAVIPDRRIIANPAWLGRYGLTPLTDEPAIPATCDCRVEDVTIDLLPHPATEIRP